MGKKSLEELVAGNAEKEVSSVEESSESTKYLIKAIMKADGVVERPDVVGAIFGQTEGILGDDLDLRELQKNDKIGRIEVNVKSEKGKSKGAISIPSSLDRIKTSIIGAALEAIDRVGPCEATIEVDTIQDVRDTKRKFIVNRAKELLDDIEKIEPQSKDLSQSVKGPSVNKQVEKYKGQPAGPSASKSDAIIIVEGRSDVINLLNAGIKNTIAIDGTSVPPSVAELTEKKTTTAFLDGDRGGDLILKELLQVAKLDYVARAPRDKTVEDLSKEEIRGALKSKVPASEASTTFPKKEEKTEVPEGDEKEKLGAIAKNLRGTLKARVFDKNMDQIKETPVRNLPDKISKDSKIQAVVFDGIITQKLADLAAEKNLKYLVGMREKLKNKPNEVKILTLKELQEN
ncbi:MAG: DNA primase [Hadesarchaea archaeon]|nr:DNA primase [Hadesarchaea archaeon]